MFKSITPQPNKLGWVTGATFSVTSDMVDVTEFGNNGRSFIKGRELIKGSIDFMAQDFGAVKEFMQELERGRVSQPVYQKEFMCLYCGSPNKIDHTHCKKCGAPRSFIIG